MPMFFELLQEVKVLRWVTMGPPGSFIASFLQQPCDNIFLISH